MKTSITIDYEKPVDIGDQLDSFMNRCDNINQNSIETFSDIVSKQNMMNQSIKKDIKNEYMNIMESDMPKSAGVTSKKKSFRKINQSEQAINNRRLENPTTSKYLQVK